MNELYHHGILGQKWGKRNGPPYPLKDGQKSFKEKSSKRKNMSNKLDTKELLKSSFREPVGELDPDLVAIGVTTIASLIGAIGAVIVARLQTQKALRKSKVDFLNSQDKELRDRVGNSPQKALKEFDRLDAPMPAENSMKLTNRGFPGRGTTQNCTFCSAAMAMREKGYDVVAQKSDHPWASYVLYSRAFNAKQVSPNSRNAKELLTALRSNGDGSYGALSIYWKAGGGHSVFWKNDNGTVRIYDGQSGEEYDAPESGNSPLFKAINIKQCDYYRLDNCEPTEYVLGLVQNR